MWSASSPATISGDLAAQDGVDRAAVAADGEGVADALGAVGVAQPQRDQFEGPHVAVRAVGQHGRQRDAIEAALDPGNPCHAPVPRDQQPWPPPGR